jgi:cystathionine beta-lyase
MFDFSQPVDRHGTWCTQWDYVADRFGTDDLLPFTISDMDFPTAPCILEAMQKRLNHGVLGYSRWQQPDFTGAIQYWMSSRFASQVAPQRLVYGPSVIYMVSQLIRQWSREGDEVLIHTPAYDAFYKTIAGNQRQVLSAPLRLNQGEWLCDMAELEQLLARDRCTLMLLCSPHNPTGKVWQRQELEQMAQLCERHGVRVISDEIHMDMTWNGAQHIPWCQVAGRGDWALLSSASKSFNIPALTGAWGIIAGDNAREHYLTALKSRDGLSSPAVLALVAHIAAYREGAPWLDALREYLMGNLSWVADTLNNAFPALNWSVPQATYLAWLDLRPLGLDDAALQERLIGQQKVAIMPGTTYGPEGAGFLRLNVGCPRVKLEQGVTRLIAGIASLL